MRKLRDELERLRASAKRAADNEALDRRQRRRFAVRAEVYDEILALLTPPDESRWQYTIRVGYADLVGISAWVAVVLGEEEEELLVQRSPTLQEALGMAAIAIMDVTNDAAEAQP